LALHPQGTNERSAPKSIRLFGNFGVVVVEDKWRGALSGICGRIRMISSEEASAINNHVAILPLVERDYRRTNYCLGRVAVATQAWTSRNRSERMKQRLPRSAVLTSGSEGSSMSGLMSY
jgi:hypothetical protein